MYIRYFATNRDREDLGRDIDRQTRIRLQKGGYNWIDTKDYMSYYLATTDPTKMPAEAIVKNSQDSIFNGFLNSLGVKRILICIHGFNVHLHGALTSFSILADTLATETKLGANLVVDPDTARDRLLDEQENLTAVVGFSWPSNGSLFDYESDRREAISSSAALANLISSIKFQNPRAQIHLVAHSMGNFLACTMLGKLLDQEYTPLYLNETIKREIERRDRGGEELFFIDGFLLLAPDVERRHVTQCNDLGRDTSSYIGPFHAGLYHLVGGSYLFYSRYDSALKASRVEKEAREKIGSVKEFFTGANPNNLWEDSLGLNPAPNLAPPNMYSFNASTLSNRPIDHGDYFDTPAIAQKIAEVILAYK